ncbi:MAG: hypothetical protein HOI70_10560 [Opitutae bacterium]|jgi:FMN phosphatase YigB (HAD superfamily)|nr:hypothetical protein [Opitutae bacterium]
MDSYDVFETALLRVVGEPTSLFFFLGQKAAQEGWLTCLPSSFKDLRKEAEREAYRRHVHPDLDQIYTILSGLLGLPSPDKMEKLKKEELRMESEWSRPNPTVLKFIIESRKRDGRVLFLSDMYLPRGFVESNLRDKGILSVEDALYLSNHDEVGKSDGGLYLEVLKNEQLSAGNIHHRGNCPHADVEVPRKLGIATSPYLDGNLSDWEKHLETYSESTDGLSSLWSGAARRARCNLIDQANNPHQTTVLQTATSVAGPLLTTYVHWSLTQAASEGVKTLVFIARDGQILYKIAKVLQGAKTDFQQLNLRYIYGSRQAWRPASVFDLEDFERSWILEGEKKLTREKVLARTGLDNTYAEKLPASTNPEVLWKALTSQLREPVIRTASAQRKQVLKYLEQEGLLEDKPLGFVEIGCTGTTLAALERILGNHGKPLPRTYFFGLANGDLAHGPALPSTYFYNEKENMGLQASSDFNYFVLLEMFCAANHGRTSGYQDNNGRIEPNLEPPQRYWKQQNGTELLQAGITAFAEAYADSPLIEMAPTKSISLASKVIRRFWQKPTLAEAETWGSYRKEHDQSGFDAPEMGRSYTIRDLLHCVRTQGLPETWWSAATLMRTGPAMMKLLKVGTHAGRGLAKARIRLGRWKNQLLGKI